MSDSELKFGQFVLGLNLLVIVSVFTNLNVQMHPLEGEEGLKVYIQRRDRKRWVEEVTEEGKGQREKKKLRH